MILITQSSNSFLERADHLTPPFLGEYMTSNQEIVQRCGFITIAGAPNAGKSTLINTLAKHKVAIVSSKPHTTRQSVYGIICDGEYQSIFVDTPGLVLNPQDMLQTSMRRTTRKSVREADILMVVIDVQRAQHAANRILLTESIKRGKPTIIVFTKIDELYDKTQLLPMIESYRDLEPHIRGFFPISSHTHEGIEVLEKALHCMLPEGPWMFPEDEVTQLSFELSVSEITREKLFISLHQEIPYKLQVITEKWYWKKNKRSKEKELWIWQNIVVEKEGHKRLVLGHDGGRIRHVGYLSRIEIKSVYNAPVHLFLHVTIDPKWIEKTYG